MHLDFIFDELGLVGKLATSKITSYKETPRRNKIGRSQVCKLMSSL
jgi:hypothetical protein